LQLQIDLFVQITVSVLFKPSHPLICVLSCPDSGSNTNTDTNTDTDTDIDTDTGSGLDVSQSILDPIFYSSLDKALMRLRNLLFLVDPITATPLVLPLGEFLP